jgi:hypothetical protein
MIAGELKRVARPRLFPTAIGKHHHPCKQAKDEFARE